MSDRRSGSAVAPRMPVVAESVPPGVRQAVVAGAWVALTVLFTVGGVVAVLSVGGTLGYSRGLLAFLATFAGVLGVIGAAPSLAGVVVVRAVDRLEVVRDRDTDPEPRSRRSPNSPTAGRGSCRTSCCC